MNAGAVAIAARVQSEVAALVGKSRQAVSKWARGETKPDDASRAALARELGIPEGAWDEPVARVVPEGGAWARRRAAAFGDCAYQPGDARLRWLVAIHRCADLDVEAIEAWMAGDMKRAGRLTRAVARVRRLLSTSLAPGGKHEAWVHKRRGPGRPPKR